MSLKLIESYTKVPRLITGSQDTKGDDYIFKAPRHLTPDEKIEIYKLRWDYHPERE